MLACVFALPVAPGLTFTEVGAAWLAGITLPPPTSTNFLPPMSPGLCFGGVLEAPTARGAGCHTVCGRCLDGVRCY